MLAGNSHRRIPIAASVLSATLLGCVCLCGAELPPLFPDVALGEAESRLARAFVESPGDVAVMRAYASVTEDLSLRRALMARLERATVYETPLETVFGPAGEEMGAGIRVTIGGRTLLLLVDTGATGITVGRNKVIGLTDGTAARLEGFGGGVSGRASMAPSVLAAGLELGPAAVVELDRPFPGGIDGVIGAEVFGAYRVRLDYRRRAMRLSHDGGGAMEGWTKVERHGDLLFVRSKRGPLLLDTGAAMSVAADGGSAGGVAPAARGVDGKPIAAAVAGFACMQVDGTRLCDARTVAMDLSELGRRAGIRPAGLIGYGALRGRVLEIDYRGGWVRFGD
ncbi:MAG: hypothetical protein R2762_23520 [Bryobacteraceae bacterium]